MRLESAAEGCKHPFGRINAEVKDPGEPAQLGGSRSDGRRADVNGAVALLSGTTSIKVGIKGD